MAQGKSKKLVYIVIIVVSIGLLLIPLITKNHIYQGVALGGDTRAIFIPLMESATNGDSFLTIVDKSPYLGLAITMSALGVANKVLHMNPEVLFFIYSLVVLFGVGVTFYWIGKILGGKRTGWITVVLGLLCGTSIMTLYSVACIINIINVYIVLLWAIILLAKWFEKYRWYRLVSGLVLLAIFVLLHPTGAYLPYAIVALIIGLGAWWIITKGQINWWYIGIGIAVFASSLYLAWYNVISINPGGDGLVDSYSFYLLKALRLFFIPVPTIVGILTAVAWWKYRRSIKFNVMTKTVLAMLACLVVVLIGASLLRVTLVPERQVVDAAGLLAIIIAIVLGRLVTEERLYWLKFSSYALMIIGSSVTLLLWIN